MESKKKYFCKYLPVEGEVKEGDKYYFKDEPDKILNRSGNRTSPNLQKVKLFLCSRDIQVGDRFFHAHDLTNTYIAKEDTINWHSNINTFKVIGEISPDATWVKEGDEFDEKQVMWQARDNDGQIECYEDWGIRKVLKDNYGYYVVAIKCSNCKTFH